MKRFVHAWFPIAVYASATVTLFFPAGALSAELDYQVVQKEEKRLEGYDISLKSVELIFTQPMFVRLCYEEIDSQGKAVLRSFRSLKGKASRVFFRVAIIPDDSFDGFLLKYSLHSADSNDSTKGAQMIKWNSGKFSSSFGHLERENRFGYSFVTKSWERGWEPGFIRLNDVFVETSKTQFSDD
jgi:hypothetical protein